VATKPIGEKMRQLPVVRFAWFNMLSALTTGERLAPLSSPTPPKILPSMAALNKGQTAIMARRNLVDRKWEQYDAGSTAATAQDKRQVEPARSYPAFTLPPFPVAPPCPLVGYTPPSGCIDQRLVPVEEGGFIQRPAKVGSFKASPRGGRNMRGNKWDRLAADVAEFGILPSAPAPKRGAVWKKRGWSKDVPELQRGVVSPLLGGMV
jgi:hypothetical protein